jgi:hypothetical protein
MDISDEVNKRLREIRKARREFTQKTTPRKLQEWIENHGRRST